MRENWRTKREAGVKRCGSVVSVQMWVRKDTYRHMFRNTHTADWHKATQLAGFTSAWPLETPVHSDYGSCTGQGTHTHTEKCSTTWFLLDVIQGKCLMYVSKVTWRQAFTGHQFCSFRWQNLMTPLLGLLSVKMSGKGWRRWLPL